MNTIRFVRAFATQNELHAASNFNYAKLAKTYTKFRPAYPQAFYNELAQAIPTEKRKLAVDVACGPGTVTIPLATSTSEGGLGFQKVIGIDTSSKMLSQAPAHSGVEYQQVDAMNLSSVVNEPVDLISIGQGLHWLPVNEFLKTAERSLSVNGTFCCMGYGISSIVENPKVSNLFEKYYYSVLGSHLPPNAPGNEWGCDRRIIDEGFSNESFRPFKKLIRMTYKQEIEVDIDDFIGYLRTWSVYHAMMETRHDHQDPVNSFAKETKRILGSERQITIAVPFWMIIGKKC